MQPNESERETIERFIELQLRGKTGLSKEQTIALLQKRKRKLYFMTAINAFAVFFFSYSVFAGISSLPQWTMILIGLTFVFNVFVIFRQQAWVNRAIAWTAARD